MKYEICKLKNDLEVIFVDLPGTGAASTQIWFRAGSTLEQKSNYGIAHFLEHMFFKGTSKRPGAKIAHDVESFGGEINAFTSFDYTCYYINSPSANLNNSIDIILDMVSNPLFKQSDLIPEREVVFEEFRRSIDNPNQYSFQRMQDAAFNGGYAHPILGTENNIKNFSRKQLIDFRKKFYNSKNAFLVVAGDLKNRKSLESTINKYKLPSGKPTARPSFSLKSKDTLEIHQKDVKMCQLTLSIECPGLDDINLASEDLAFNVLGHGESSILHKTLIRNGAIANSAGCSTMLFSGGGIHFLRVKFPEENLKLALDSLSATINHLTTHGVDSKDVEKIKNQYVASKVYEKESIESFSFSLGNSYAQTGDLEREKEFLDSIRRTTVDEVSESFARIFKRPLHLSIQLPKNIKETKYKSNFLKFQKDIKAKSKVKKQNNDKATLSEFDQNVRAIEVTKGIKLIYRYNPMTPTFVMHAYAKGALTEETPENNGIYNLLASQLTKGIKGMDEQTVSSFMENHSATFGHFSGKNAYGLTLHGQSENFDKLGDVFLKSFTSASFNTKNFNNEKKLIKRQILTNLEDPTRKCFEQVNALMFKDHPYSMGTIGNLKSISKIKASHVKELHQENLKSKEILITYCGDGSLEHVKNFINKHFKEIERTKLIKNKKRKVTKLKNQKIHIEFDREQTQIFIGTQTNITNKKEVLALKMLTTHLSGQSSELFVDVRDRKGLCYVAQPIHHNALEAGYWGIYMASGFDKVPAAIDAINSIIDKVRVNGLKKSDFSRIKKMIKGQNQISLQMNDDYANIYSTPYLQGLGLDYFHKTNVLIENLTYNDFQVAIKSALSKAWVSVTVGKS